MGWMGNQAQVLLSQLDPPPWQLRDPSTRDGHGLGMHHGAVLLPGMVPQSPSGGTSAWSELGRAVGC